MKYIALLLLLTSLVSLHGGRTQDDQDPTVARARTALLNRLASADLDVQLINRLEDELGETHLRFRAEIDGYPLYGQHLLVSVRADDTVAFSRASLKQPLVRVAKRVFDPFSRLAGEMAALSRLGFQLEQDPEPVYVRNSEGRPVFALMMVVSYQTDRGPARDRLFLDAASGDLVARHPQIHYARDRKTYDANNGNSLPGTLRRSENSAAVGDPCLDEAHDNVGKVYDYFNNRHGRDSVDGSGQTITTSVHVGTGANQAYWSNQLVLGDGDGTQYTCFGKSVDVVGHELAHAVNKNAADLIYSGESGALNEGNSDIFAAAAEAYAVGVTNGATWTLGEEIYTPGTAGDAMRYMANPTQDGSSKDYYPERYTGSGDNGGVHFNSGIANLFFYLLCEGGTHPRGKTTTVVNGIGLADAERIWYRALTTKFGPGTNFAEARVDTVTAAEELFGTASAQAQAVAAAWSAVGVADGSPTTPAGLENGAPITGLNQAGGGWLHFPVELPAGATNFTVTLSGGSGDADLYLRYAEQPTDTQWSCRPYAPGNSESCSEPNPSAGTWNVGVKAYQTFSGVSLVASWDEPGGCPPFSDADSGLSGNQGAWTYFTVEVPACAGEVSFAIDGGSGDADLYVRPAAQPTLTAYQCRPWLTGNKETCTIANPAAGTWHVGIYGYAAYSGVTLTTTYQ